MGMLEIWLAAFLTGWQTAGEVAAMCLGGVAAVFLGLIVAALFTGAAVALVGWAFDRITTAMAKRWEKTGRRPAGCWADVIARGWKHEE